MRHKRVLVNLTTFALAGGVIFSSVSLLKNSSPINVEAGSGYTASSISNTNTIYLKDNTESEIRSYYSSLNSLSNSNRTGTQLLASLKPILSNNQKYYSYDNGSSIWQIYEITDRDWSLSPASSTTYGTYNAQNNTITNYQYGTSASNTKNNPYIHALYRNPGDSSGYVKAWGDHSATGINREHVWPKSRGFDIAITGARGDVHHLLAGDGYVNQTPHNNNMYGNVDMTKSYLDSETAHSYDKGNYRGVSETLGSGTVFEPQDCDKGDIARACFYMVARYNNIAGTDSAIDSGNPNLTLADTIDTTTITSTSSSAASLGVLSDLLEWHKLDPVDEYELHRNNLIYNNYTNNRNPFIDFPEWVDYIWGDKANTAYATPATDAIYGYNEGDNVSLSLDKTSVDLIVGNTTQLTATNNADATVTWTSSTPSVASVSNTGLVTALAEGSTTITASITVASKNYTATCEVGVTAGEVAVTKVTLSTYSLTLGINSSMKLTASLTPSNATNKNVTWSSDNTAVATVSDNGIVKGISSGNANITVTTEDGGKTATCVVSVGNASSGELYQVASSIDTSKEYLIAYVDENDAYVFSGIDSPSGRAVATLEDGYLNYNANMALVSFIEDGTGYDVKISDTAPNNAGKYMCHTLSSTYSNNGTWFSETAKSLDVSFDNGYFILKDGDYTLEYNTYTESNSDNGNTGSRFRFYNSTNEMIKSVYLFEPYEETVEVSLTSIEASVDNSTINNGGTAQISISFNPSNATNKNVSYLSSNESVATVSQVGLVTGVSAGKTTITITSAYSSSITDTVEIIVLKANDGLSPEYAFTVTEAIAHCADSKNVVENLYYFTGKITSITNTSYGNLYITDGTNELYVYGLSEGGTLTKNGDYYTFNNIRDYGTASSTKDLAVGDTIIVYGRLYKYVKNSTTTIYEGDGILYVPATEKIDVLSIANLDLTTSDGKTYGSWSDKSINGGSAAIYAGFTKRNGESIQIKNDNGYGIISSSTGGILKDVEITFNTSTLNGRKVYVYGSNTAFITPNGSDAVTGGTLLKTITYESSTKSLGTNLPGDYNYIYITSNGAVYLDSISITWTMESEALNDARSWSLDFVNNMTCSNGESAPNENTWSTYSNSYKDLSADAKEFFKDAEYTVDGSTVTAGDSTYQSIAEAVARYEAIVLRYSYSQFMQTERGTIGAANRNSEFFSNDNNVALVVIVSIFGITCVGGYFFIKRKEH